MAQAAPRRGEKGAAAAFRARGGDPRLRAVPQEAPEQLVEPVPPREPTRRTRVAPGASKGRRRALTERAVPGVGLSVNDGSGFVLGVLAWLLTVQYLRGGTAGVKAWLRAKFLNQTTGGRP